MKTKIVQYAVIAQLLLAQALTGEMVMGILVILNIVSDVLTHNVL